jgi:flagellar biosynthesis/type III secretory pathway protein FliH
MGKVLREAQPSDPAAPPAAADAAVLLEGARAEAEKILSSARRDAFALLEEARSAHRESIAAASRARASVEAEQARALAEAKPALLRLALAIAAKVVERAVEDDQVAVAVARQALERLAEPGGAVVLANPEDAPALRRSLFQLGPHGAPRRAAAHEVLEDPTVARGGVFLQTEAGYVDARTQTRLHAVACCLGVEE